MSNDTYRVQFFENHLPHLPAGEYRIEITQEVILDKNLQPNRIQETYQQIRNFYIASERFTLPLQTIHSVFPPESSVADYTTVLPHIVLHRSTLPWERQAGIDHTIPWLALLLFHEDDRLEEPEKLDLKAARTDAKWKFNDRFPRESQEQDQKISIIKIPDQLLAEIIPTQNELKLLAHARQVTQTIESEPNITELAVIIGNRQPQPGRNIVHLVSLENYFLSQPAQPDQYKYFVSLKSWEFECKEDDAKNRFKKLLTSLNHEQSEPNTLRLPQQKANQDAEKYLSQGYVPASHHLRNSEKTISWYRGPLLPGKNQATIPSELFPVHTPDRLLRYLTEIDMFDVSYAAAYQLGQLLAIQDKSFSASLYNWKRQQLRNQRRQTSTNLAIMLDEKSILPSNMAMPEDIKNWFTNVWLLKNIPFNYLVPDPRMLPEESIRFFWLDNQWLECFSDGAFALGNNLNLQGAEKIQYLNDKKTAINGNSNLIITGFFLRSILLSEFPALKIQGFGENEKSLTRLRMENLSNTVLICLFAGEVRTVKISMGAEILHFGIENNPENSPNIGKENQQQIFTPLWKNQSQKIIDIISLANQRGSGESNSASFALALVQRSPQVIFKLSS